MARNPSQVVLLIDEYDKPLVDYLNSIPTAKRHREVMKTFFSVIKDADPHLKFFLITGVSKFSKVSLFSDLNHLQDITFHPGYATLTGYTQEEIDHYFSSEYDRLAAINDVGVNDVKSKIKNWYNGYQWKVGSPIYNSFSVLNLFESGRFDNYCWES